MQPSFENTIIRDTIGCMNSPFEQVAQDADDAHLVPDSDWLGRRITNIEAFGLSIVAVDSSLGRLGRIVLDGRISTNRAFEARGSIDSVDPTEELARLTIGIMPTAAPGNYRGHELWSPDTALAVATILEDKYDCDRGRSRPHPTGNVSMTVFARSWGKLSESEVSTIEKIDGVHTEYADNGYSRLGSRVVLRRDSSNPFEAEEIDTILAPLAKHILNYYEVMNLHRPSNEPTGDFSDRNRISITNTRQYNNQSDILSITAE